MTPATANVTERIPLLAADYGPCNEGNVLSRRASRCVLHTENCFLSDGSSKNNAEHRQVQRKLLIACILCVIFMVVEVVGGYLAHSLAILSDAAHMLSDVAGFAVSLFASWVVTRKSHAAYSFGYHRIEILGALASVLTIWAVTGALVFEAIMRVMYPEPVDGKLMFMIACAGIGFNLVIAVVLGEHHVHGIGGHDHHHHDDDDHHGHHGHGHALGYAHSHSHGSHGSSGSHSRERSHDGEGSSDSDEDEHVHGRGATGHLVGSCCVITVPMAPSSGSAVVSPRAAAAGANGPAIPTIFSHDGNGHEVAVCVGVRALAGSHPAASAAGVPQAAQGQQLEEQAAGGESGSSEHGGASDSDGSSHGHSHGHGHCHGHGKHHGSGGQQSGVAASLPEGAVAEVVCEDAAKSGAASGSSSHSHCDSSDEEGEAHARANGCKHGHGHGNGDHAHNHGSGHKHSHQGAAKHKHGHEHGHGHKHGHEHHEHHGEGRPLHGHQGHGHSHGHPVHSHGYGHGHGHGDGHSHGHSHGHGHGHGHHGHSHGGNINLRSAVLHVVGDLLQSIGVAAAGALIWWRQDDPRWQFADPLCTFLFAGLVMWTTRGIIADIMNTLMERSPQHYNLRELMDAMTQMEGILDVHDLHVWNLSMGLPILTAHVHIADSANADAVLRVLEAYVQQTLGIQHSTIQICNYQGAALAVTAGPGARAGGDGVGEEGGSGCPAQVAGDTQV